MTPPRTPAPLDSAELVESRLRQRDTDPAYANAPVLDVYGRISRNPETGELEKVDRQLLDCLRDVERRHARLGEVLRDDGISAWSIKAKRPGWNLLVSRLESRTSGGVVAWHSDRLLRQPRDLERLVDLGDRGLLVASCHGDYDLSDADHRFTLRVLTAAAAKESDNTSRRQKRKAKSMRDAGRPSGGPRAFGMPGHGPKPKGWKPGDAREPASHEQVQAERDAIAYAVRGHLDGLSLNAIAAEWNRRKLRTIFGHAWDARTVGAVMRAPRIAGLLAHNGNVVGRLADVEPIVTEQEWGNVVALFKSRRHGRPVTDPYPLSGGHLICGREGCGNRLTGRVLSGRRNGDGTQRRVYLCYPPRGCSSLSIEMRRVETEVRNMVIRILSDPKNTQRVARQSTVLAEAVARLAAKQEIALELARRLGEGQMTLPSYDAATPPLEATIAKLSAEVDALRLTGAGTEAQRQSAADVAAKWDGASVDFRRVMVRQAAPRGIMVLPATPEQHARHTDPAERLRVL